MLATSPVPRRSRRRPRSPRSPSSSAACGGSTTPTGAASAGAPSAARQRRPRRRRRPGASPRPARRLHRRARHDRVLDLGRPAGDRQPDGARRRVPRRQPGHHGQRRRRPTGTPTGTSSRPGSPAAPRPTCSRWTARCSPTTSRATCCSTSSRSSTGRLRPDPARRPGRRRLHDRRRRPVRPAARPQRDRPLLQQGHVRRGRHPVSRRHLGLGQARRGRQAADHGRRTATASPTSGASTPRPRDMENYWLSLVWQNGGDVLAADGKSTVLGTDEAAGGIQFLQDLIWKDKIMPDPAIFADDSATRSSRARPPWRPTAPGSSRPSRPPASTSASRRSRTGPPGRFTSVNPTGRRRLQERPSRPDAAWEFVKYLASPAAQEQLMQLKASLPVNKEVLAGPYATSFDGAQVFADSLAYAKLKPSFKGYDEFTTIAPGRARRATCSTPPTRRPRRRSTTVVPELNALLAGNERTDGPPVPPRRRRSATAPGDRAAGEGVVGAAVPRARPSSGWPLLSAGPIVASFGISLTDWDLLPPPQFVGPRQLRRAAPATPGSSSRSGTRRSTR